MKSGILKAMFFLVTLFAVPHAGLAQQRMYMSPQGAWSGGSTYQKSDVILYGGNAYYSTIADNSGNTPSIGSPYWAIFSSVTSGGTTVTLQTNGNANGSQALLNLVCTGSTTCTNSGGVVTITSSASSSGPCPLANATNLCITQAPYSADNTGNTDATSAFQSAINALSSLGGTIWVPDGTYNINGALQDTSGANAVLTMPKLPNYSNPNVHIAIKGLSRLVTNTPQIGARIATNATTGNFIGGYDAASGGGFPGFTGVGLELENLTLISPGNSSITMVNGTWLMSLQANHLLVSTTTAADPTTGRSVGIAFPTLANAFQNYADDVATAGYYTGMILTEHTQFGSLYGELGHNCFVFDVGANTNNSSYIPVSYHGNSVSGDYIWTQQCDNSIVGGANPTTINIQNVDIELPGQNGIYDPNNMLHGIVNFLNPYGTSSSTALTNGQCSTPTSGGANLSIVALYCAVNGNSNGNNSGTSGGSTQTVTSNNSNASMTVSTTSSSYAGAHYIISANGADTFAENLYNGNNSAAFAGALSLVDASIGATGGKSQMPWVYTANGDWCFLVPYSSSQNFNTCPGALFRLNHDGTTVGFSGGATAYGTPTMMSGPSGGTAAIPGEGSGGWPDDDHAFTIIITTGSSAVSAGGTLATLQFGKSWQDSAGNNMIPNCTTPAPVTQTAAAVPIWSNTYSAPTNTHGGIVFYLTSGTFPANTTLVYMVQCQGPTEN